LSFESFCLSDLIHAGIVFKKLTAVRTFRIPMEQRPVIRFFTLKDLCDGASAAELESVSRAEALALPAAKK
jgi:hypothetical protein